MLIIGVTCKAFIAVSTSGCRLIFCSESSRNPLFQWDAYYLLS